MTGHPIPTWPSSEPPPIPPPPWGTAATSALARARALTEAAGEALKVADNLRTVASGADGHEREILLAKARGADSVMVHLIRLANAADMTQSDRVDGT